MRIRRRKNLKKKNTVIVFLFLMPIIGFFGYASILLYMINDLASYNELIGPPDTDYFIPLDRINETELAEFAKVLDDRNELYHMPTNLSVSCTFTDYNYNTVKEWHGTDNGALWGGELLASQCLRYATAKREKNSEEMNAAMRQIKRLVSGFSMLLAVPNGGIGPDYPGIPARFYASPSQKDIFPFMFEEHYKHFNGTGKYKNWRCRLSTSLDEMGGYAIALGTVLKFIDPDDSEDAKWCYERVKLLIAQLIEGFKKTNWLVLTGDGTPAGSDLNMDLGGGAWKLTFLKLGSIAYPEKYESEYYYTYSKALHSLQASEGSITNTLMEYYAFNFAQCLVFSLIINENNPKIRYHYIKLYVENFYGILKYHRNAWINSAYLAFMSMLDDDQKTKLENPEYGLDLVKWDVLDQLYRFKDWIYPRGMNLTKEQGGIRNYNLTQRPHSTRATSMDPRIRKMERNPIPPKWRNYVENDIYGKQYAWIREDLFELEDMYLLPITVSEWGTHSIIWGDNPFYNEGGDIYGNGLHEERGLSFLLPYWIGRYYGFISKPST
ncbi:MAG: hypothetical protein ACTSPW_13780 [Promethearchaeota archaeon]